MAATSKDGAGNATACEGALLSPVPDLPTSSVIDPGAMSMKVTNVYKFRRAQSAKVENAPLLKSTQIA
jgi:hypothetical protein